MVRYSRSRLPSRYWMEWNTGDACGLTLTRSWAFRYAKYSAVIAVTSDALEAWWPPTFTPSPVDRSWLAASTIRTASHRTRRWISSSTSRSTAVAAVTAAVSGRTRSLMSGPLQLGDVRGSEGRTNRSEAEDRPDRDRREQRAQAGPGTDRQQGARGTDREHRAGRADGQDRPGGADRQDRPGRADGQERSAVAARTWVLRHEGIVQRGLVPAECRWGLIRQCHDRYGDSVRCRAARRDSTRATGTGRAGRAGGLGRRLLLGDRLRGGSVGPAGRGGGPDEPGAAGNDLDPAAVPPPVEAGQPGGHAGPAVGRAGHPGRRGGRPRGRGARHRRGTGPEDPGRPAGRGHRPDAGRVGRRRPVRGPALPVPRGFVRPGHHGAAGAAAHPDLGGGPVAAAEVPAPGPALPGDLARIYYRRSRTGARRCASA